MNHRQHKTTFADNFFQTDFCAEDAEKLANSLAIRATPCLQDALTDIFYMALCKRAEDAHGVQATRSHEFIVGAGLFAADLSEDALEGIEKYLLGKLYFDKKDDLLGQLTRLGKMALYQGELRDGVLSVPTGGAATMH